MARRKNAPESVRVKQGLADRVRMIRTEFYGERGGPDLARTLGVPVRTWYNYENGVTVPAEIILRIVELTSVEPTWLLRGEGAEAPAPGFHERRVPQPRASLRTSLTRRSLPSSGRPWSGSSSGKRPNQAGPPARPWTTRNRPRTRPTWSSSASTGRPSAP